MHHEWSTWSIIIYCRNILTLGFEFGMGCIANSWYLKNHVYIECNCIIYISKSLEKLKNIHIRQKKNHSVYKWWYDFLSHHVISWVHSLLVHSSEIGGLCLMKWPSIILQNLPHFYHEKTHVVCFLFHFMQLNFFP